MTFTIDHVLIIVGFVASVASAFFVASRAAAAREATTALKIGELEKDLESEAKTLKELSNKVLVLETLRHEDRNRNQQMEQRHANEMTRLSATLEKVSETLAAMRVDIASIKSTVRGDTGEVDVPTGVRRRRDSGSDG